MFKKRCACSSMKVPFCVLILSCHIILTASLAEQSDLPANNTDENVTGGNYVNKSDLFLEYIFTKYGSNGKISYEGFEHLLENLGLAQLKFDKNHTLRDHKYEGDGSFEEIHDKHQIHKHAHAEPKNRSERSLSGYYGSLPSKPTLRPPSTTKSTKTNPNHCFTTEEMLSLYNLEANHELGISHSNFLHMCPLIVYELDQKSCLLITEVTNQIKSRMISIYIVWLSAFVSIFVVSFVGLLGVCMVPLLQKAFFNELISFLVALAVGTLCGDSVLHLLPHALEKEKNEDDTIIIMRAGTVFLSILVFFLIETVLYSSENEGTVEDAVDNDITLKADIQLQEETGLNTLNNSHSQRHSHSHNRSHTLNNNVAATTMSAVALMVIMGDGLHNLTDGLAIGAAFSGDIVAGFTTTIAVFTHELPHELGDFAVLLQTGMTVNQAVFYNIVSSILSFIGMAAGMLLGNYSSASHWIYAVTAGVFLYIGLVNLVPEMKRTGSKTKGGLLIQISGIMCGGIIMFLIAIYEHDLELMFLQ